MEERFVYEQVLILNWKLKNKRIDLYQIIIFIIMNTYGREVFSHTSMISIRHEQFVLDCVCKRTFFLPEVWRGNSANHVTCACILLLGHHYMRFSSAVLLFGQFLHKQKYYFMWMRIRTKTCITVIISFHSLSWICARWRCKSISKFPNEIKFHACFWLSPCFFNLQRHALAFNSFSHRSNGRVLLY